MTSRFDEELKARALHEDCPLPPGFEARFKQQLEALPEHTALRRRPLRGILIAAAVWVTLLVSALALSPGLREALSDVLGGFAPYSQAVEGVTAVDQGIELAVVSALADSSVVKVYVEARDLTGSRITGPELDPSGMIMRETPEESLFGFGSRCVGYDSVTKTALLEFTRIGSKTSDTKDLVLTVSELQPGWNGIRSDIPIPTDQITGEMLESMTLDTGEIVLVPGHNEAPLGVEHVTLSSIGFASDGQLHILFRFDEAVIAELSIAMTTVRGPEWVYQFTRQPVEFAVDGVTYCDWAFEPPQPDEIATMTIDGVYGSIVTAPLIEGAWTLPLTVEILPERVIQMSGIVGNVALDTMVVSALGVTMAGRSEISNLNFPFAVFFADGTILHPETQSGLGGGSLGETRQRWEFDEPIDPDQIIGISLAYWYIPIEGNATGAGYWLKEIP